MPLIQVSCTHCGFWHPWFEHQKPMTLNCVLCSDVRNALPPDGWDYADVERVGRQAVEVLLTPGGVGCVGGAHSNRVYPRPASSTDAAPASRPEVPGRRREAPSSEAGVR